ncbi:hypothetical protein MLD38_029403 [Melastoma candidum]|uniref:Uncharacterized protein n=1 Tax=Melastoma candidum TaxID=119954 RepID=A0ACB9N411_9MYRT|nr:hypothetical protein MLD38_029403 [Melastoma candidum]
MPELPEVEAARRAVHDHCLGKRIRRAVVADDPKVIDGVSSGDFEAALVGKTIVSAKRKGKNLWLELDSPPFPSFQFGMAGAVYIKGVAVTKYKRSAVTDTDEWPSKYSKVFLELDDGLELSFTDKRRFARVRLLDNPALAPPISDLGPDALLELMTIDEFTEALSKKKIGIKALLLDQGFVAGIGNWIADEVLYQARIHPLEVSSSLSREKCATLLNSIKEVIEKAIEVGADSSQFPSNWIFHSRENKPGKAFVNGKKIDFISAGGRTTAYVPELQQLSSTTATKIAGKSKQTSKKKKSEDDDNDGAAVSSDDQEEETIEDPKSKKPQKPKGRVRKLAKNRAVDEGDSTDDVDSDDDEVNNDQDGEINKKRKNSKTKVAAKKTSSKRTPTAGKGGKRKKQG